MLRIRRSSDVATERQQHHLRRAAAHFLRNLAAVLAAVLAWGSCSPASAPVANQTPPGSTAQGILVLLGVVLSFVSAFAVGIPLSAKVM